MISLSQLLPAAFLEAAVLDRYNDHSASMLDCNLESLARQHGPGSRTDDAVWGLVRIHAENL
jgi:hypothetical protein